MDVSQRLKPATVKKKTGKSLEEWFKIIDKYGASKGHKAIAKHLQSKYKISVWWAQSLTTRYEFDNDLRKLYQRSNKNNLTVTVQKTIGHGIIRTYNHFSDTKAMKEWFSPYMKIKLKEGARSNFDDVVDIKIKKIEPRKRLCFELISKSNEEVSPVEVAFIKKESKKTLIKITQSNLSTTISVNAQRDVWKSFLAAFKNYIDNK